MVGTATDPGRSLDGSMPTPNPAGLKPTAAHRCPNRGLSVRLSPLRTQPAITPHKSLLPPSIRRKHISSKFVSYSRRPIPCGPCCRTCASPSPVSQVARFDHRHSLLDARHRRHHAIFQCHLWCPGSTPTRTKTTTAWCTSSSTTRKSDRGRLISVNASGYKT